MKALSLRRLRILRNNLRIMRNMAALEALFPRIRQGVLVATLTQPEKWWYLSELAEHLHTTPSSLQRELAALVAIGILQKRREGARKYFKAQRASPLFPELRGLFDKTAGLIPVLQEILQPLQDKIECAFVYGSVARGEEGALSDVDLMVIGSAGLAALSPALRKAESRLGREINVTSYSESEFRQKLAAKDHFLSTVLRERKQFVKGGRSDLDKIIG